MRSRRHARRHAVGLVVASLVGCVIAGCGGDTDGGACMLPAVADRLPIQQEAYIKPIAGASPQSSFGAGVAVSGDGSTLVIGAPLDPSGGLGVNADPEDRSTPNAGAAYVFVRAGATWVKQAYLKPSSKSAANKFGWLLAVSKTGDTLVVGVPEDSNPKSKPSLGATVVFRREGVVWREEAYLRSSQGTGGERFGSSVALSDDGDTMVVGAPYDAGASSLPCQGEVKPLTSVPLCPGAATVFQRTNGRWEERAILSPPDGLTRASDAFAHMGARVAVSGDGSAVASLSRKALLVFRRGTSWTFDASVEIVPLPPDPEPRWLSLALSSDGRTIAVGQPRTERVEVFTRQDAAILRSAIVRPLSSRPAAYFGWNVALSSSGTHLAVSAWLDDSGSGGTNPSPCAGPKTDGAGAAFLFAADAAGEWKESAFLKARVVHVNAGFGDSLALDGAGTTLVVGAPGDPSAASGIDGDENDASTPSAGAAYVFR